MPIISKSVSYIGILHFMQVPVDTSNEQRINRTKDSLTVTATAASCCRARVLKSTGLCELLSFPTCTARENSGVIFST